MGITFSDPDTDTDADIADIAALSPSDGDMLYWATGGTRYNTTSSQSYGRSLLNASTSLALKTLIKQPFVFLEDYGTTAADFQTAWAAVAAAGGGKLILPEATIAFGNTQVTLDGSNVTVCGMGYGASIISSTYTSGPAILLGNNSTQTLIYAFEDVKFQGAIGQTFFKSRYVRGLYLRRCGWDVDRLICLGDSAAGTSKPAYIFHMEDCPSAAQINSPTLHHIYAENFAGQWVMSNVFVEGKFAAGVDGFYCTDNIQNRIDHVIVSGGYFSRFRDNYSFVDARTVNFHMAPDHESELALRNAVRFEVTTATAKTTAQVGWANVLIAGKVSSSGSNAIYMKSERTGTGCRAWDVGPCIFTVDNLYTPVLIESLVGEVDAGNIHDLTVEMIPADVNQDVVKIVGGSSATTVSRVGISNIAGSVFTNPLRSVVRVEGFTSKITRPKNIGNVSLASTLLSDARLAVLDEYEYIQEPEGRLTLTTATPVLSASVTAAATIYYTPYKGNRIPLLTESLFCERAFTELSLALDSDSGHTGYHQADKNFDLFIYNDAGTLRLCSGPAWTNDSTRSAAITLLRGLYVNNATITLKYDTSVTTISAAANSALYVGTFRASANGQTEMSIDAPAAAAGGTNNKLFLWNAYNQTQTQAICRDSTDTWTYTTAAFQAKNASNSNRVSYIAGLVHTINARAYAVSENSGGVVRRYNGIGLNSTTAIASGSLPGFTDATSARAVQAVAEYRDTLAAGFNYLQEIEYSAASGTSTWYGDGGGASVIQTGMIVNLMM